MANNSDGCQLERSRCYTNIVPALCNFGNRTATLLYCLSDYRYELAFLGTASQLTVLVGPSAVLCAYLRGSEHCSSLVVRSSCATRSAEAEGCVSTKCPV